MKVKTLKTDGRKDTRNDTILKIQSWGKSNDYPQKVMEIVAASTTGQSCVNVFHKFVRARGFANEALAKCVVNGKRDTADDVLRLASYDYCMLAGMALHVNWNAMFQVVSIHHIPLEQLRLGALNDNGKFDKYAVHSDWGKRYISLKQFREKDITYIDKFNPDPAVIQSQVDAAGGWDKYKGQILLWSNQGQDIYPVPSFESALTDMSSEEGLCNLTHRNVRNSFIPAGMLVDHDNQDENEAEEEATKNELNEFQGDMNAGKIMYVTIRKGEEAPEFKPFAGHNTDKDFNKAEEQVPDRIGRAFSQPPILRSVDVGGNFGADLMQNAYNFYNSVTDGDRTDVSAVFAKIFEYWWDAALNPEKDFTILPLFYKVNATIAERLGGNMDKVLEILFDASKSQNQKKVILSKFYGLDEDDINDILEGLLQ